MSQRPKVPQRNLGNKESSADRYRSGSKNIVKRGVSLRFNEFHGPPVIILIKRISKSYPIRSFEFETSFELKKKEKVLDVFLTL